MRQRSRRVLVTGAAGFVGSHLCERLVVDGHDVIGLDSFQPNYQSWRKRANLAALAGCRRWLLHTTDLVSGPLDELLTDVDVVIHLAGCPGVRTSWGDGFELHLRNNIHASQRLLEAVARSGVTKLVYASSSSVYGNGLGRPSREDDRLAPVSPYAVTKLAVERLCHVYERQSGTPTVGLRMFTVYGPRQRPDMAISRFVRALRSGEPVELYDGGRSRRELTYVDDAVDAVVRAAFSDIGGVVVNVGGHRQASTLELAEMVAAELGRPLRIVNRPPAAGDATVTSADHELARTLLGYRPVVSLEEGIRRQVDSMVTSCHRGVSMAPLVLLDHRNIGTGV